ncbi:glycosyltransferase family A protein [Sabulibacter ruber]|uniref:glycosyltransferase family A protein n=1 Tax=Sabulibacter ruber TaxID=2811901 RepID=UPI001A96AE75|nr:glycosyltransferase family 2 protein [Sabulibacter ruber]
MSEFDKPLVSIIMPAYNAGSYIFQSIQSVVNQTYLNWELIIVDDGSTDNTAEVISQINDVRIKYFRQSNQGVASARNKALTLISGDFFCFLDADDVYPKNSLLCRLQVFKANSEVSFVDGVVRIMDSTLKQNKGTYQPSFRGNPRVELAKLSGRCFMGPSWMIKRVPNFNYCFRSDLTHSEDLIFFMSISDHGFYDYTKEEILLYRSGHVSAMSNLDGLEKSYVAVYNLVKDEFKGSNFIQLLLLKVKIMKIMFLSFLVNGKRPLRALKSFIYLLFSLK